MEINLVKVNPKEFGIEENQTNEITKGLSTVLAERELLIKEFDAISTLEVTESNLKMFKELRVRIMKNRTQGIEAWHKVGKKYFLRGGQFCDAIKKKESQVNEQMESKLAESENYFINLEKERIAKLREKRIGILLEFVENPEIYPLGEMEESDFDNLVNDLDLAKKAKIKAEKEAEDARIAKEKAEAEERERIHKENERLKKDAEEKEKQLAKERAESAKIAEQLKQKQVAEANAKFEQEQKDKAELLAKKKAEKAPDKEKLIKMIETLQIEKIFLKSKEALDVEKDIIEKFTNFKKWANEKINNL